MSFNCKRQVHIHKPTITTEMEIVCLEEWSKIYFRKRLSAVILSEPSLNINGVGGGDTKTTISESFLYLC